MPMKLKRLYLLSGPSGCGKSTWAQKQVELNGGAWVSRDKIRFKILEKKGGEYFDHEGEVLQIFYEKIQESIDDLECENIYVDATHLNRRARNRVLDNLNLNNLDEINCVFFDIDEETAIERNKNRTGLAFVPRSVIRNMAAAHTYPDETEDFTNIIVIDKEGNEVIK